MTSIVQTLGYIATAIFVGLAMLGALFVMFMLMVVVHEIQLKRIRQAKVEQAKKGLIPDA